MASLLSLCQSRGSLRGESLDASEELSFFDRFAGEHGEYDVLGRRAYRRLLGVFATLVSPQKGEYCLDLGCGTGHLPGSFQRSGSLSRGSTSRREASRRRRLSASETYRVGDIRGPASPLARPISLCTPACCITVTAKRPASRSCREGYRL